MLHIITPPFVEPIPVTGHHCRVFGNIRSADVLFDSILLGKTLEAVDGAGMYDDSIASVQEAEDSYP